LSRQEIFSSFIFGVDLKQEKEIKPVYVKLDQALHTEAIGIGKAHRGQSAPEVYTEALTRWLEWVRGGATAQSPLGDLAPLELRLLRGLLAWLRDPESPKGVGTIMDVLERLADAYESKTRGSNM
jgi:hypothetical protein